MSWFDWVPTLVQSRTFNTFQYICWLLHILVTSCLFPEKGNGKISKTHNHSFVAEHENFVVSPNLNPTSKLIRFFRIQPQWDGCESEIPLALRIQQLATASAKIVLFLSWNNFTFAIHCSKSQLSQTHGALPNIVAAEVSCSSDWTHQQ